jgi:hypothetical protein
MVRTQIYLTQAEQNALSELSCATGRSKSDLIREAIDQMVARQRPVDRLSLLRRGRGIWKHRSDLPDFAALRRELDRTS